MLAFVSTSSFLQQLILQEARALFEVCVGQETVHSVRGSEKLNEFPKPFRILRSYFTVTLIILQWTCCVLFTDSDGLLL